jgi:hypothetical protein
MASFKQYKACMAADEAGSASNQDLSHGYVFFTSTLKSKDLI